MQTVQVAIIWSPTDVKSPQLRQDSEKAYNLLSDKKGHIS